MRHVRTLTGFVGLVILILVLVTASPAAAGQGHARPVVSKALGQITAKNTGGSKKTTDSSRKKDEDSDKDDEEEKDSPATIKCKRLLRTAGRAYDAKDYEGAARWLRQAGKSAEEQEMRQALDEAWGKIKPHGEKLLAEAEERLKAKQYRAAIRYYRTVAATFDTVAPGPVASEKLAGLLKDPAIAAEIKAAQVYDPVEDAIEAQWKYMVRMRSLRAKKPGEGKDAEAEPARPPDEEIVAKFPPGKLRWALDRIRMTVKLHGESETGRQAADLLAKLEADPAVAAATKPAAGVEGSAKSDGADAAKKLFGKAQMYHNAGLRRKAVDYYRELISDFPDSEYAAKAKEALRAAGERP